MKLRRFVSRAVLVSLSIVILGSCSSESPTQSESAAVTLDKNRVADLFGNHDGATTSQELAALNDYFASDSEAWCLTDLGQESWYSKEVGAARVKSYVEGMATHPYASELTLREAYDGMSIKTPFVSVSVLLRGDPIAVTKFFRSPGPNISTAEWEKLAVKQ